MKLINNQKHRKTCSVVAYANLHKLMGRKMSYKKAYKRWKKRGKGRRIIDLADALSEDFNVYVLKLPYRDVMKLAKEPHCAVAVNYTWLKGEAHVSAIDRNGESTNTPKKPVTPKRWKETRKFWKTGPLTIVITEKD